jgi:hypothetical protein
MESAEELDVCKTLVCLWEVGVLCGEIQRLEGGVQLCDLFWGDGIGGRI